MLSACVHQLRTQTALRSPIGRNGAARRTQASPVTHGSFGICSKSCLADSSNTGTRLTTLKQNNGLISVRLYASKKSKKARKGDLDDSDLDSIPDEHWDRPDFQSLDSFFQPGQADGETTVFVHPRSVKLEDQSEQRPEDLISHVEEQAKLEKELRDRFNASESEFEMAMGTKMYRPVDKKGSHKIANTVALEKLAKDGTLTLSDLADLDYESLKLFAETHEVKIEDFFHRTRTAEGEVSEFSISLNDYGDEEIVKDSTEDGLVEHSREYLRAQRPSTKNFRDRIRVRCMAGSGGKGGVSFYRDTRVHRGPPDGGDGGDGGSVIFIAADNKKPSLAALNPSYRAGSGMPGSRTRRKGKSGNDVVIEVPLGTTITEFRPKQKTIQEELEDDDTSSLGPPAPSDVFMNPELASEEDLAESAAHAEAFEQALKVDISSITDPEERRQAIEDRHRAKMMDPRAGKPWAPPNLDDSHPMAKSASDFHRIISDYNSGKDSPSSTEYAGAQQYAADGSTVAGKSSTSFAATSAAAATPEPYFSFDGSPMPGKKGKKGTPIYIPNSEWSEMAEMEEELGFLDEESSFGSDLVDKYRLKSPKDTQIKESNLPRTVELDEPGAYFIAAKGGAGGLGNFRLGAVRNRPQAVGTPGKPGESLIYQLELKLIADVGLVGFPNAGKSTFLSSVSRANPKIASYPFTTLSPEIGTVMMEDETQFTIADLPGLIEGAHQNRGLGHQFLKHIERTSALVYMIDMSGSDKRNPWDSFLTLWDELELYQASLVQKPSIVVANKMDSGSTAMDNLKNFSRKLKSDKRFRNLKLYPISAASRMNVVSVINKLRTMLGYPSLNPAEVNRKKQLQRVRRTGIATQNVGVGLGDAMRQIR